MTDQHATQGNGGRPAGALAFHLAAVWLAVLAIVAVAILCVIALAFASLSSGADVEAGQRVVAIFVAVEGALVASAVVAWRAASAGRGSEELVALVLGGGALLVVLGPAFLLLLPLDGGFYGLDPYALATAARLPWSVAVLVPAALMGIGATQRWCASSGEAAQHRGLVAWGVTLALVVVVGTMAGIQVMQPTCGAGRTCVPAAGVSFVLPDGWRRTATDDGDLFAASAGSEQTRFVIEDGGKVIGKDGGAVPTGPEGVDARATSLLSQGSGFGRNSDISARRVDLPVGPAIRIAYTSSTSFIFTYYQTNVTHWLSVDGRLVVLEYMTSYGEGTPGDTSSDPADLTELLASLQVL